MRLTFPGSKQLDRLGTAGFLLGVSGLSTLQTHQTQNAQTSELSSLHRAKAVNKRYQKGAKKRNFVLASLFSRPCSWVHGTSWTASPGGFNHRCRNFHHCILDSLLVCSCISASETALDSITNSLLHFFTNSWMQEALQYNQWVDYDYVLLCVSRKCSHL